jgi:hypothetical protein
MAAQNLGNIPVGRQLIDRLIAYKSAAALYNVGLNGHACRVLADAIGK